MLTPRKLISKGIGCMFRIVGWFNPVLAQDLRFLRLFKKRLNRENPEFFGEKIIVRMESDAYRQLTDYADKWKVREYVDRVIGEGYHIPILAVYDDPKAVRYDQIPEGAYIKLNHACGYNIVYQKQHEKKIRRKVTKWYHSDFTKIQLQYVDIKRKILVEENLTPNNEVMWEYSFFTFHGKVEFAQIRDNAHHRFEVGRNYEALPFRLYSFVTAVEPKDPEYDRMVELAEKLAEPFEFVRVDFFKVGSKIYFGELTFSPGAGLRMFSPYEYNKIFGDKL